MIGSLNSAGTLAQLLAPNLTATGDGTTDDTASINAQLAAAPAGSVLRGVPGKTYKISAPLVLRAGGQQTLDMTGCTITLATGSNCNLLNNAAVTPAATVTDGAMTSGSATLTTAITGAVVGQTVTVSGAGNSGNSPLTATVTAVGSGTLTLSATAQATVTAATVKRFVRDTAVRVIGGTWARGANAGTGLALHNLQFRHIDGLTLDVEAITSSAGKYAVSIADASRVWVRARGLATASDGVHLMGPISGARIEEITGSTGDDTFAITAADWPTYGDTSGDVYDVSVGRIEATSTAANLFKVIAGAGCRVDNVKVTDGIYGTAANNGVWIGDDTAQAATTGGTYGMLDLGLLDATFTNATSKVARIFSPNAEYIHLKIRSVQSTVIANGVTVEGTSTATIGVLHVEGVMDASTSNPAAMVQIQSSGNTVDQVILDGCRIVGNTNAAFGCLLAVSGGAVGTVDVIGCVGKYPAASGFYVRILSGAINAVNFIGGQVSSASVAFRRDAGTGTMSVSMSGGFKVLSCSRVADCRAGTTAFKLDGPHFDTLVNAAFFTNAATLMSFDGFISTNGAFTMLQRQAAEAVSSRGAGLPFDVTALTQSNGDAAYNTNAATAGGVGRVISDGTTWKPVGRALASGTATLAAGTVTVSNTSITVNSLIRLTTLSPGGTVGHVYVSARTAGTGFTITSTSGTDTSIVFWEVVTY